MILNTSRTTDSARCPVCQKQLSAATGRGTPKPGDRSVCSYCGVWLIFNTDLTLRLITSAEITSMPADERADIEACARIVNDVRGSR